MERCTISCHAVCFHLSPVWDVSGDFVQDEGLHPSMVSVAFILYLLVTTMIYCYLPCHYIQSILNLSGHYIQSTMGLPSHYIQLVLGRVPIYRE